MEESYEEIIHRKVKLLNEWHNSSEYKNRCRWLSNHAIGLVHRGEQYAALCVNEKSLDIIRTEIGSDSGLHRGFYCPSIIYDTIVGNVSRGKLLKRLSPKSKAYFLYGFGQEDRIVLSKRFLDGHLALVEHLFYNENYVYGVTLDTNRRLASVSLEIYDNGKIVCYEHAQVLAINGKNKCVRLWQEDYVYDSAGLKVCYQHEFYPSHNSYTENRYTFTWTEGRMAGYRAEKIIKGIDEIVLCGNNYGLKLDDRGRFGVQG